MCKLRIADLVPALCILLLVGCGSTPTTYRVVPAQQAKGDDLSLDPPLLVLPPGTTRDQDGAVVKVDLLDVVIGGLSCYGKTVPDHASPKGLHAAIIRVSSNTGTARALRLSGSAAFESPETLSAAWSAWWQAYHQTLDGCLIGNAESEIRYRLLTRRPARAAETVEALFGFHPRKPDTVGQRAIILRPGITVCANDVAPYEVPNLRWIASGTSACVTMVNAPQGGSMFAAAAGRLGNITDTDWVTGQLYRVESWSEVPGQTDGAPRQYVLVLPRSMPTQPPEGQMRVGALPLIFGADARDPDSLRIVLSCAQSDVLEVTKLATAEDATYQHIPCVTRAAPGRSDLSKIRPMVFKLGERGIADPKFTILVNEHAIEVDIGSTLGDVIDRLARVTSEQDWGGLMADPKIDQASRADIDRGLRQATSGAHRAQLARILGQVALERWFDGRLVPVDVSAVSATADALPLQPGDRISW